MAGPFDWLISQYGAPPLIGGQPAGPQMFDPQAQKRAMLMQALTAAGQAVAGAPTIGLGLAQGLGAAGQGALQGKEMYRQGAMQDFQLQQAQDEAAEKKRRQDLIAQIFPGYGAPMRGTVTTPGNAQYASAGGPTPFLAGAPMLADLSEAQRNQLGVNLALGGEDKLLDAYNSMMAAPGAAPGKVGEYNAAIAAGVVPPETTYQQYLAMDDAAPADQRLYEYAKGQGFPGSLQDFLLQQRNAGRSVNTINMGSNGIDYGDPESGLAWARNTDGTIKLDERGIPIAMPYQGSKAYADAQKLAQTGAEADQQKQTTASIVTEDIGRALGIIEKVPEFTTGVGGNLLSSIPGTGARDVAALLDTVKANAGFDKLQAMRAASPTGGALGNVTERELALLQAAIGNLEQSQSKDQLVYNMKRVANIYSEIVNGSGHAPYDLAAPASGGPQEWTIQVMPDGSKKLVPAR